jgi:hypothetical protein
MESGGRIDRRAISAPGTAGDLRDDIAMHLITPALADAVMNKAVGAEAARQIIVRTAGNVDLPEGAKAQAMAAGDAIIHARRGGGEIDHQQAASAAGPPPFTLSTPAPPPRHAGKTHPGPGTLARLIRGDTP